MLYVPGGGVITIRLKLCQKKELLLLKIDNYENLHVCLGLVNRSPTPKLGERLLNTELIFAVKSV
jgi:hypothetical protein